MSAIRLTPRAYVIVARRAQETGRSPDEIISQILAAQSTTKEHPYIERRTSVLRGKPFIKGTQITVWEIAERIKQGDSPDDLVNAYSHVQEAALFDAINYYYDYCEAIEIEMEEERLENGSGAGL